MNLPMLGATDAPLLLEHIPALQDEVRLLAADRGAVVLAHNYQLPEIQDVADYVGDSLGLSQEAAKADVETKLGRALHVWDGECHVHAGIKPDDISAVRAAHPGADFLIHPECGCSTSVMEYVAAGDVDAEGVHMLSTGGMLNYAHEHRSGTAIVATETGMLHPLRQAAPDV